MSKPNVTRVQSATQWNASVHTLTHVQTCDYVRVQSATQWNASVHTLTHVQTCDYVRVQSATQCWWWWWWWKHHFHHSFGGLKSSIFVVKPIVITMCHHSPQCKYYPKKHICLCFQLPNSISISLCFSKALKRLKHHGHLWAVRLVSGKVKTNSHTVLAGHPLEKRPWQCCCSCNCHKEWVWLKQYLLNHRANIHSCPQRWNSSAQITQNGSKD